MSSSLNIICLTTFKLTHECTHVYNAAKHQLELLSFVLASRERIREDVIRNAIRRWSKVVCRFITLHGSCEKIPFCRIHGLYELLKRHKILLE